MHSIRPFGLQGMLTSALALLCAAACSSGTAPNDSPAPSQSMPSWEEFRQSHEHIVEGRTIYIIEWDLSVSLEGLRNYYDAMVANAEGLGINTQELIADAPSGIRNVWAWPAAQKLTYCVTNDFGADKSRVVNEMSSATLTWERLGSVNFRYLPSNDATCNNTNPSITFAVRPWTSDGACAPIGADPQACIDRTLTMNLAYFDARYGSTSNIQTVGAFRHEVGHILGFRHEHTRPEAGIGCYEDNQWQALTSYDVSSVMHYPQCNGSFLADWSISPLDRRGASLAYPLYFSHHRTFSKNDLNNDGKGDICGRGPNGIECALSSGTSFASVSTWTTSYSDSAGWNTGPEYYSTLAFPDVNGDGKADTCGRGPLGIYCSLGTGTAFGSSSAWSTSFSDASGWNSTPANYGTIRFPDLNGDGKADVCGRITGGIYCAISSGTSFGAVTNWSSQFSNANGWNLGPEYYSTIEFPDVNGDGKADVCGRGASGTTCAISTGSTFGTATVWSTQYSDGGGWNAGPYYWGTIAYPDVNGDGKSDTCGRGVYGIYCSLSTGTSFGPTVLWTTQYDDASQWNLGVSYYSTISFPDLNNDGKADVCGRSSLGVTCAISSGSAFGSTSVWSSFFNDSSGWAQGPLHYATISYQDLNADGKPDVCGRSNLGIHCALNTGSAFGTTSLWVSSFTDASGWHQGPEYYGTIRLP